MSDRTCPSRGEAPHSIDCPVTAGLPAAPVQHRRREAVADELARHADTMTHTWGEDTVRLGCRCGHDRGTVTKAEWAAGLDGHVRAYRLHVADAVLAMLGGEGS